MITRDVEEPLNTYLKRRCAETAGVYWHAVGGTQDHLHLCISIPPSLLIADWIGEIKGASAHYINHQIKPKALQWQSGYGVVSFGRNNLDFVKQYVQSQKDHHAQKRVFERLERIEAPQE